MRHAWSAFVPFFVLAATAAGQAPALTDAPDKTPSDFARFVKEGDGGHFDTAITTYKKGDVELILFGAVHIADQACYDALNDRFAACEALLYELVGPADYRPTKDRDEGFNPLSMLQKGLKTSMELSFQLDVIDYGPANFVHADMTPEEFQKSMADRGESLLSIMMDMMISGMKMQRDAMDAADGSTSAAANVDLVKAFRTGEGRHTLRMLFASQLEQIELMAAGGKKGEGGTLIEGRNEKCLEVLAREMAAGKKKLGIYYGAAHLPHMEHRLVTDLGFQKVDHEWLVAWDCKRRPDVKYDRALVKQRQSCKAELGALAVAARDYRRDAPTNTLATVHDIAASKANGVLRYTGSKQDPWGHDYVIEPRKTGARWQVRSLGQDGVKDTDDDLVLQEPRR
ncbi:MAG: type II secretion system protein GspG [Planctomycetota bacterium]|nr:type II secretion system protein GspG [Planctomycetota bacterium]